MSVVFHFFKINRLNPVGKVSNIDMVTMVRLNEKINS